MTRRTTVAVLVLGALAVTPAPAGAALPKPSSTKIVPGRSIGGVRLGMSLGQVRAAWGAGGISEAGDACTDDGSRTSCIWTGGSTRERALVGFSQGGGVDRVTISGGPTSPLARWRTSRGFGIGTGVSTLSRKLGFGAGRPVGLGSPPGSTVAYLERGTVYYGGRSRKVIAVGMASG